MILKTQAHRVEGHLLLIDRVDHLAEFYWQRLDAPQVLPIFSTARPLLTAQVHIAHDGQIPHIFHREGKEHLVVASLVELPLLTQVLVLLLDKVLSVAVEALSLLVVVAGAF